jgi:L-threonylcarbamoyladenylate synthase
LHVSLLNKGFDCWKIKNIESGKQIKKIVSFFWPGPLTIITEKSYYITRMITAFLNFVAIRMPKNSISLKLINLTELPIAAPSANISTRPSSTSPHHVLITLMNKINGIINSDISLLGIESTVTYFYEKKCTILRFGIIGLEELKSVLSDFIFRNKSYDLKKSPGNLFKHYSPRIEKIILIKKKYIEIFWNSQNAILVLKSSVIQFYLRRHPTLLLEDNSFVFAKKLYNSFYKIENLKIKILAIERPSKWMIEHDKNWLIIEDKIKKASDLIL